MLDKAGRIASLEVIHKVAIPDLGLPIRWVVWGRTEMTPDWRGDDRVWLRIVEDDGDENKLKLRLRSLLVKEFFSGLVGTQIEFSFRDAHEGVHGSCYGISDDSLPEPYGLDTFLDIHDWFSENRPECLANDMEVLRKKKAAKTAVVKAENKERRAEYRREHTERLEQQRLHEEKLLAKRREDALKLTFRKGWNRKRQSPQWEARHEGVLYVLDRESAYAESEGVIPVEERFDLVPDRVVLVSRI